MPTWKSEIWDEYRAFGNTQPRQTVIPEPASLAIWSLLAAVGVVHGVRKRRQP